MRIIHLSDIHVWRYEFNPIHLLNKRAVGVFSLLAGRARRFRLERIEEVVAKVQSRAADHILITGDLTTTALSAEFRDARDALSELLVDPTRVTVIPGNHDRYTTGSVRYQNFEAWFGAFAPDVTYPWLRHLDSETAILGLDPTRSHLSARGLLPAMQLAQAREMMRDHPKRLIVACHYPVEAPPLYAEELAPKRMKNALEVGEWLSGIGQHLYCCGHVHAAWGFVPRGVPNQLCLNSGAPLLRDPTGMRPPGFLEIELQDDDVTVTHHAWTGTEWSERPFYSAPSFYAAGSPATSHAT
ncbi:metallophosphoesterase family protein [Singulisphaera sp. PoT]|uniref:metallophosphoesterase family protein n=1 Tax=Singulisphaera sp. PoT TaxID=3411797 RepID=UPI003BF4A00E